jgi:hypothetical protein
MRNSKRNSLSLRVPFRKEEPAYALLGRIALRYGHVSLRSFASCVDVGTSHLYGRETMSEVAKLAGIDPVELAKWSPMCFSRHKFQFQNMIFGRSQWIPQRRRCCPLCVQEDMKDLHAIDRPWMHHRRFWWDFRAIDTCPIHQTCLIDTCPRCKTRFERDFTNVRICRCKFDLATYTPDLLDNSDCEIDGYILARLLGSPRSRLGPLENMPLSSAVLAIAKVGSLEVLRKGERFEAVSRKRRLECKMTAGEIFQSWPESFDEILDRRVLDSKECQPKSLGQTYGVWAS